MEKAILHVPTTAEVLNLDVGDKALDCFGRWSEVKEIRYRGTDINGKAYVGYATDFGDKSTVTGSYKADEAVRTVALTREYNSAEVDALEKKALSART